MQTNDKIPLAGKTLEELQEIVDQYGRPKYTAEQIAGWLYTQRVDSIEEMTNLPKTFRQELERSYTTGWGSPVETRISSDGTRKYLFRTLKGGFIETAYIPDQKRHTLCVSSQVGCKMGCTFCMTARQGFQGQLSAGEMLNQVCSVPESQQLTNIVFMGMGEPLDNLKSLLKTLTILTASYGLGMSPRRITVSTIGLLPAIQTFLEKSNCHLAISLHSPFEEERKQLVPAQKIHPLKQIIDAIRSHPVDKQRRISFEYIVFNELNHSHKHVKALARLLQGIRCRINLIRFHPVPGSNLRPPSNENILTFKEELEGKGLITTIRRSRGEDIQAACGLLSTAFDASHLT